MKKIKLLGLFLIVVALTGCLKYDISMKITEDKKVSFVLIEAVGREYEEYLKELGDPNVNANLGYVISNYADENYVGYKMSKEYKSIDDISANNLGIVDLNTELEKNANQVKFFKSTKNASSTTYSAHFILDLSNQELGTDPNYANMGVEYEELINQLVFRYTVTLPTKPLSSNASSASNDGKTLVWDMKYGVKNEIKFSFTLGDVKANDNQGQGKEEEEIKPPIGSEPEEQSPHNEDPTPSPKEDNPQENQNSSPKSSSPSFTTIIGIIVLIIILIGYFYTKFSTIKPLNKSNSNSLHQRPRS